MANTSAHQFIRLNAAGRVLCACREHGVRDPKRIAIYTRAVEDAVHAAMRAGGTQLETMLSEQMVLLIGSLSLSMAMRTSVNNDPVAARTKAPSPVPPPATKELKNDEVPDTQSVVAKAATRKPAVKPRETSKRKQAAPKAMVEKLAQERKPLQKLLNEDCVNLGLLTKERAEAAARNTTGRTRQDAEEACVAELRNNLHTQVRTYMRKNKGGPWPKPKDQEDLRLDITTTKSVHAVLMLARQILRERNKWEENRSGGVVHNLLGGKLRWGFGRGAKS